MALKTRWFLLGGIIGLLVIEAQLPLTRAEWVQALGNRGPGLKADQ